MQYYYKQTRSFLLLFICSLCVLLLCGPAASAQTFEQQTVMLVLGSANIKHLRHRVEVAAHLYHSNIEFQRIIVSGGCGAHRSSICEASKMDSLLIAKGIPARKIFKEEKSRSTKQNYCYSRKLTSEGELVINASSRLYVVSDHWHAISVAACFREVDGLKKASYHIDGVLNPRGPADYTNIFRDCSKKNFCRTNLWAFVDAAYYNPSEDKIYYFTDDIFYRATPGEGIDNGYPRRISRFPGWPEGWDEHLDAAYYNSSDHKVFMLHGEEIIGLSADSANNVATPQPIPRVLVTWPKKWGKGYPDAAYYDQHNDKLYLFKGSEYITTTGYKTKQAEPMPIETNYTENWPFQWGTGNIDAAFYRAGNSETYLYRGTDFLEIDLDGSIESTYPKAINLPWPEKIWGAQYSAK